MLFHAGGHGQYVGVDDDVLGWKTGFRGEQPVGALCDGGAALEGGGLSLLVEAHHHHGGAQASYLVCPLQEHLLALLERERVDDALALQAFQGGLDYLPVRRVDHHRHAGYVGLGGDGVEKVGHLGLGVEQTVVHVDVHHLRAVGHLVARYAHGLVIVLFLDEAQEFA